MAQLSAYTAEPRDFLCKFHTSSVNAKEVWVFIFWTKTLMFIIRFIKKKVWYSGINKLLLGSTACEVLTYAIVLSW